MKQLFFTLTIIVFHVQLFADIPPAYTIIDLGTLGGKRSYGHAINDNGQIVGHSHVPDNSAVHAFFYDGTEMNDIGLLSEWDSYANDINNSGQIVGRSLIGDDRSVSHGYIYNGTEISVLSTLGGKYAWPMAINNMGIVTGGSYISGDSAMHTFVYDGINMHDLGTLGGTSSWAYGINDSGQIVGGSNTSTSEFHAFLFDGTSMHDLGVLDGVYSNARDINSSGHVVGSSDVEGGRHAFYYDGMTMYGLGTLGEASTAHAINDSGQIVGDSFLPGNSIRHAFLYDDNKMIDLNTLLPPDSRWTLMCAYDINNSGQITGYGHINGTKHAFLMTPALSVFVDIKPQSCPNPVNFKSKGVLPVAILGSDVLDVNDIDYSTVLLEGVTPLRGAYEDVTSLVIDDTDCACTTAAADGYMDLTLKFKTQEILAALGEVVNDELWMLHLTGNLRDGTPIEGADCILIKKLGEK